MGREGAEGARVWPPIGSGPSLSSFKVWNYFKLLRSRDVCVRRAVLDARPAGTRAAAAFAKWPIGAQH
jgi:hypothetical protein